MESFCLTDTGLFEFSISSYESFVKWYFSRNVSISSKLSSSLGTKVTAFPYYSFDVCSLSDVPYFVPHYGNFYHFSVFLDQSN